jgi:HSP20 family protein
MTTLTKSRPSAPQIAIASPRNPWALLRSEMDDLLAQLWNGEPGDDGPSRGFAPALDLCESETAFEIRMDIPGLDAKDIDIQVRGNTVTLSGQRKEEKVEKGSTYHRVERRSGSFWRTVTLPCDVNADEVAAEYTQGVLIIKLPKSEVEIGKRITVKA